MSKSIIPETDNVEIALMAVACHFTDRQPQPMGKATAEELAETFDKTYKALHQTWLDAKEQDRRSLGTM